MRVTWPGPSACGDPRLEHFPEKWTPVFRQGNATNIESRALSVYGACDFMVNLNGKRSSAPLPKFVIHCGTLWHELRKQRGTGNSMILVPLFDLKFLSERAAGGVGTSNRRH